MSSEIEHHSQLVAALAMRMPCREISYDMVGHLSYLADRLSLSRHGFPVVNDVRISDGSSAMDCGVMRIVFDGFNPDCRGDEMFDFVGDYSCRLSRHVEPEDLDLFSVASWKIVDETVASYAHLGVKGIEAVMGDKDRFPELAGKSIGQEISLIEILSAVGVDDPQAYANEIESHIRIDRVLSVLALKK